MIINCEINTLLDKSVSIVGEDIIKKSDDNQDGDPDTESPQD